MRYYRKPLLPRRCGWCGKRLGFHQDDYCNDEHAILAKLDTMGEWIDVPRNRKNRPQHDMPAGRSARPPA